MAEDDLTLRFGAAVEGMTAGVEKVRSLIESIHAPVDALNEKFNRLAEIMGIAFSIEGFKSFVESMAELGEKTVIKSNELGVSAEKVGELSGVAKLTGTSIDALSHSFERMTLMVQRSGSNAFSPAARGLAAIGLNARDLIGLSTDAYFEKLAAAVSKFNPSMNLTNAIMAVGGRGVMTMIPALMKGAEGFREMEEAVRNTGATMDDLQARSFAETSEKIKLLSMSFQGLGIKIFDVLKPAVDAVTGALSKWVQSIKEDDIRAAVATVIEVTSRLMIGLVNIAQNLGILIDKVVEKFKILSVPIAVVTAIARGLNNAIDAVTSALFSVVSGTAEVVKVVAEPAENASKAWDDLRGKITAARDAMLMAVPKPGSFEAVAADAKKLSDEIGLIADEYSKLNAKPMPSPPTVEKGQFDNQIKQAQEAYSVATKLADDQFNQTKEHLAAELKQHQITDDQERDAMMAALDAQFDAQAGALDRQEAVESAALAKITALYPQGSAQWQAALDKQQEAHQKYLDKIVEAESKYHAQHNKMVDDAATADVETWTKAADQISGAFDSQLQKLLSKQESFKVAMQAMSSQLVLKIIEDQVKLSATFLALKAREFAAYVAAETGMTEASAAGAAVRAAASAASGETSILQILSNAIKSISASAGQTSAEVAAEIAPVSGPAAPAIGAAAGAATLSTALGFVAQADVGGYVVSGGLLGVHAGETVVPASVNQPYQGGGAGANMSVTIQAIDTQTGYEFLQRNLPALARNLSAYMNLNPSYR